MQFESAAGPTEVDALQGALAPFLKTQPKTGPHSEHLAEFREERKRFAGNVARFRTRAGKGAGAVGADAGHHCRTREAGGAVRPAGRRQSRSGRAGRPALQARGASRRDLREGVRRQIQPAWSSRDITRARKAADEAHQDLTKQDESLSVHTWGQLRKVRYFWSEARWLTGRFPGTELRDVDSRMAR